MKGWTGILSFAFSPLPSCLSLLSFPLLICYPFSDLLLLLLLAPDAAPAAAASSSAASSASLASRAVFRHFERAYPFKPEISSSHGRWSGREEQKEEDKGHAKLDSHCISPGHLTPVSFESASAGDGATAVSAPKAARDPASSRRLF